MAKANSGSLPLSFRSEEVTKIFACLTAGNSCQLVGIGSVGKSNLLRFLGQRDVLRANLGKEWIKFLLVYVDANKLLQRSEWGLWELMLHQMLIELATHGIQSSTIQDIDDLHRRAIEPSTRHIALRYLDRAVSIVCKTLGLRLIFLFDEFDDLYRGLAPQAFSVLRALRDDHKYRLMYVVATRVEIFRLSGTEMNREAFEELIAENTLWLTAYSEEDAQNMLQRLLARHKLTLDQKSRKELLQATGGHPGLIRASFPVLRERLDGVLPAWIGDRRIREECQRIWASLSKEEQKALTILANGRLRSLTSESVNDLRRKGLIGGNWAKPGNIFSSILAAYICKENPSIGTRVQIDRQKRIVWVDDLKIQDLAFLEYRLLEFLESRRGQVCTRYEIGKYLYRDEVVKEGFSDNRIDSIVKRLRKQVERNPKEPELIITVHGVGFRLVDGENASAVVET